MTNKVLNKIFSEWLPLAQTFFTTKPTWQGTGLGLSLSYDIITKGHGGVPIVPIAIGIGMKVETKEGEGSEFIIQLQTS